MTACTIRCHTSRFAHGHRWVNLDVTVPTTSPLDAQDHGGSIRVDGTSAARSLPRPRAARSQVNGAVGARHGRNPGRVDRGHRARRPGHRAHEGRLGEVSRERSSARSTPSTMGGSIRIDGVDGTVRAETMGGSVHVSGRFSGECSLVDGRRFGVGPARARLQRRRSTRPGTPSSTDVPGLHASRGQIEGTVGDRHRRLAHAAHRRADRSASSTTDPDPRGTVWVPPGSVPVRSSRGSHARSRDSRWNGRRRHRCAGVPGRRRGRRRAHQ